MRGSAVLISSREGSCWSLIRDIDGLFLLFFRQELLDGILAISPFLFHFGTTHRVVHSRFVFFVRIEIVVKTYVS